MRALKTAGIAAALAVLGCLSASACDYAHDANVTASVPASTSVQVAAPTSQPAPAAELPLVAPPTTQTADTSLVAPAQPKMN